MPASFQTTADVLLLQMLEFFTYNFVITRWIRLSKRYKKLYQAINPNRSNLLVEVKGNKAMHTRVHPLAKRLKTDDLYYILWGSGSYGSSHPGEVFTSLQALQYTVPSYSMYMHPLVFCSLQSLVILINNDSSLGTLYDYAEEVFRKKWTLNHLKSLKIIQKQRAQPNSFYSHYGLEELWCFLFHLLLSSPQLESFTMISMGAKFNPWFYAPYGYMFSGSDQLKHVGIFLEDYSKIGTAIHWLLEPHNPFPSLTALTVYSSEPERSPCIEKWAGRDFNVNFSNKLDLL